VLLPCHQSNFRDYFRMCKLGGLSLDTERLFFKHEVSVVFERWDSVCAATHIWLLIDDQEHVVTGNVWFISRRCFHIPSFSILVAIKDSTNQ
jgi:hypothetical protein